MSHFDYNSSMLVVVCKRPALHVGKQRVAKSLGAEIALQLAELLLATAIEDALDWGGPVTLAPASPNDADWAAALLPGASVIAQPDGNLGQRINRIDTKLRAQGSRKILYIGSDSPALDGAYLHQAHQALEDFDIVIGPALDGGVTLMGSRLPWPALDKLPWSSARLHRGLAELALATGLSCTELDGRYDVDEVTDLRRVWQTLHDDPRPARQALCGWIHAKQLHNA